MLSLSLALSIDLDSGLVTGVVSGSPTIALSTAQDVQGDATGTAIGTISGGTGPYTLTDATNQTQIASGNLLQVGTVSPPVGAVTITIHDTGTPTAPDANFTINTVPQTPTISLDPASDSSGGSLVTNINTPNILINFPTLEVATDVVEYRNNSVAMSGSPHTITAGEISGSTIDLGLGTLSDAVYNIDMRHDRSTFDSAWSSVLTFTVDTVAPTLSAQSGAQALQTTANLSVTTNEGVGHLYYVVTGSATPPSAAQIIAGHDNTGSAALYAGNQTISSIGVKTATATGLSAIQTDYAYFVQKDVAGNISSVVSASWPQADITAPILSNANATGATTTSENLAVDTDTGNGTLYWIVSTNSATPTIAQVKAGSDGSTIANSSQSVSITGTQSMVATGLSALTNYYGYFVHTDSAANNSNVLGTGVFQTGNVERDAMFGGDFFPMFINQGANRQAQYGSVYVTES